MTDQNHDEAGFQEAVLAASDLAYDWDLNEDRIAWFGRPGDLFGGTTPPATGAAYLRAIYSEDVGARLEALNAHLQGKGTFDCEYRLRGEAGRITWVHDRGSAVTGPGGTPQRLRGLLRIITHRKQREARLEYLANFDELTGHFNAPRLRQALDHALAYSARYQVPCAYLAVGIDRLTQINDAHGTTTADAVIVGVGRVLDRCLRVSDTIGRLGGDRFGVVLANCAEADVQVVAEKILDAVRRTTITTPGGPFHVTVSIGGAAFMSGAASPEAMARADSALAGAKNAGRDCFVAYSDSEEHRRSRQRAVAVAEDVQAALKSDRLVLAFQPIVTAIERQVDHYECLIRMRREDGTIVPAGAFVPVVEHSALMRLIDRRALELAVHELNRDADVRLAINISGLTAADRSWLRSLNAMLKGRPDLGRRLTVEITETVALQDIEESARFVAAVRSLGCRVALDDFGAGYSSFRNLKALAVDCVKIDGSFVRGLADNVDNQLFIRTLLGLADGFGLATVAECVETAADATHLERRGVKMLQGYYFGRPTVERPWVVAQPPALKLVPGGRAG